MDVAKYLDDLCDREEAEAKRYFDNMPAGICNLYLIEACRVLDYEHVLYFMTKGAGKYKFPEFDTLVRGWNPFLAIALPRMAEMEGIPIRESTEEFRAHIRSMLYRLGSVSVLRKAADMLRGGFLVAATEPTSLSLRMSDDASVDHFLDALDHSKLDAMDLRATRGSTPRPTKSRDQIREQMRGLVFPWETGHGTMVGYGATEEIDDYFGQAVDGIADAWRSEAGIHADAKIGATTGGVLAAVSLLLASFYLKHIQFVDVASQVIPNVNYPMALTIWKDPGELAISLSKFMEISAVDIRSSLEMLSVDRSDSGFFASEQRTYIPMLIKFSDTHYVSPASSIFSNALVGARMLEEHNSPEFGDAVRRHREGWMIDELRHLFLGNRYLGVTGPTKLSQGRRLITDVDWAVLDVMTGELAIFQLKWQDYSTSSVRKQRSKARNFVDQVDQWSVAVQKWIVDFGIIDLLRALRIKAPTGLVISPYFFAIGRSNARFASYGIIPTVGNVASAAWPQFVRLRHDIGPQSKVISRLHGEICRESSYPVERTGLPHEVSVQGQLVRLEDLWSAFPEDSDGDVSDPQQ